MLLRPIFVFSRQCQRGLGTLAYNVYGSKDNRSHNPLVIGHGLFGQKTNWNSVAKQLQKKLDNQVFAIDLRNHGESPHADSMTYPEMVQDVCDFIQQQVVPDSGYKTVHLLGHSMGGKVASLLSLTAGAQDLLESVIIEDISPASQSRNIHFRRYTEHMLKMDLSKSRKEIGEDLSHIVTDTATRQFLLTNLTSEGAQDGTLRWKPNLESIGHHIEHILRYTIDSGCFDKPSLLVYGEKSGYVKEEDYDDIRRLYPKMQFKSIPKAGHMVHADNPTAFIDAIVDFIEQQQ